MINDVQVNATEETALQVDAANGVLANDTSSNGPLTVVEGWHRTAGGGQIYFFPDGSYFYTSSAGFSGTDSVQFTALDASNAVAGTATLTINVAATADLPFVSIGTQLGVRHVVDAGFPTVGNGIHTSASQPVALTGGGYVITVDYLDLTVDYLDQAPGSINQVQTYDANNNLVGTFDPGTFVHNLKTTALTNGDYVVGWDTFDNSGSPNPTRTGHFELFNAKGKPLGAPVTLRLPGGATGISQIAALPGGGVEALWFDSSGQLFAWSFDTAGGVCGQSPSRSRSARPADQSPRSRSFPTGSSSLRKSKTATKSTCSATTRKAIRLETKSFRRAAVVPSFRIR